MTSHPSPAAPLGVEIEAIVQRAADAIAMKICRDRTEDTFVEQHIRAAITESLALTGKEPFALFAGFKYYPHPGWQGHCGQFDSVEAASVKGKQLAEDNLGWWQVVDLRTREIVAGEGSGHTGLFGECPAGPDARTATEGGDTQ